MVKVSELEVAWQKVLDAFDDWISYESTEFMPWTGYLSMENLRDITHNERIGWMNNMIEEVIPGRVDACRQAGVALEDFLPYMPNEEALDTVRSMMDLNVRIQDAILSMSDAFAKMLEEYKEDGLEGISHLLQSIADIEEDIRHHMSLFSKGFGKLGALGLEVPD